MVTTWTNVLNGAATTVGATPAGGAELSVSDFGAVGDGVTDDAAAFTACPTNRLVRVPPGAYLLNSDIAAGHAWLIDPGATFTGTGKLGSAAVRSSATGYTAFGSTVSTGGKGILIGGANPTEGGQGSYLYSDGHANWNVFQSSLNYNPTELIIYGAAGQGRATATIGTDQVTRVSGTAFTSAWIGKSYFYINDTRYKVATVTDADNLTVQTTGGGAVSFASTATGTFHWVTTTGTGTCNTNGTAVTRVGGQPFIPFGTSITIGGVDYAISSWTNGDNIVLTGSAGTQTAVTYTYDTNINDQISTLRVQKTLGANEENLTFAARANGEYMIAPLISGSGSYYPVRFYAGSTGGSIRPVMELNPNGYVTLGGRDSGEAMRVLFTASQVNRIDVFGATTTGSPNFRARGSDTDVGLGIDTKGAGAITFTRGSFATTTGVIAADSTWNIGGASGAEGLRVSPVASQVNRTEITGSATGGGITIRSRGSDTNINIGIDTKGTGSVNFTSGSFGGTNFKVYHGASAVNYITVTGASTGNSPLLVPDGSDTNVMLDVRGRGTGGIRLESSASGRLGFYGTAPAAKPTVSGSCGGNAALASLVGALASLGLITDSTTA